MRPVRSMSAISTQGVETSNPRSFGLARRVASFLSVRHLVWLVALLGGLLRLYRYDALSLWVDEGLTVSFGRLPWPTVLGLHGAYETHPPLYFVLVKAAEMVLPELTAGRLISVIAGTLTIPVMYALGRQLFSPWPALLSSVVLAFSPLHVWYSQEARPYALTVLLVLISYLALVAFRPERRNLWATIYGVAVLLALYADYSALYALVPQLAVLAVVSRRKGRPAITLWVAGTLALVGYLPWVSQLLGTMQARGAQRTDYLGVTLDKVGTSLLSVTGLAGNGSYFWGSQPVPWDNLSAWQPLILLLLAIVIVGSAIGLWRSNRLAAIVSAALLPGTILTTALLSLISPGYAERTVLFAVPGWSLLLCGLPLVLAARPVGIRLSGLAVVSTIAGLGIATLLAIYTGGDKQHWRDLAADVTHIAALGKPVLTYPAVTDVIFDAYQPHALDGKHTGIPDYAGLPDYTNPGPGRPAILWLSYIESGGIDDLRSTLAARGYQRVLHKYYWNPLYLDLYALPGARLPITLDGNGQFAGSGNDGNDPKGWQLPSQGARLLPNAGGGRYLALENQGIGETRAYSQAEAQPYSLYLLEFRARSNLQSGEGKAFLLCADRSGALLEAFPDGLGAHFPNDGQWHDLRIAAFCPAGTGSVVVDLRNAGAGEVSYGDISLQEESPAAK